MRKIQSAILISSLSFSFVIGCSENSDLDTNEESYSIGGVVAGLNGDSIILQNNAADDTIITENGEYTLLGSYSNQSAYNITITKQPEIPNQICTLTENAGTIDGFDINTADINCINTYIIGGELYDLYGRGSIFVSNNTTDVLELFADGRFEFDVEVEDGGNYLVVQTNDAQSVNCVVVDGTGVVASAPVTNVRIHCNGVPISLSLDDRITSFESTIYLPILRPYCQGCHESGGSGLGRFADLNIDTAYNDAIRIINVPNPAASVLINKVFSGHHCWVIVAGSQDCNQSAAQLSSEISAWISQNYI